MLAARRASHSHAACSGEASLSPRLTRAPRAPRGAARATAPEQQHQQQWLQGAEQQHGQQQPTQQRQAKQLQSHRQLQQQQQQQRLALAALALGALQAAAPGAASAVALHAEPANALSLPTWAIHVSSVAEWAAAMGLMWRYAEVSGNPRWKGMTWGMMPCLGSAMAACTWHFFYNSPELDWLVALQAFLTVVGNCTCCAAAYRVYAAAQAEGRPSA